MLASEICKRLDISYVPYELIVRDENYYSVCPDMVDQNTELVPMDSVYQDIILTDGIKYDFFKLIARCQEMHIPHAEIDLLKMFLLDFIIANEDRHSFNIGFLRNADTLEWIGVAPVYDSGKSMFLNKLDFEMDMTSSFHIPAKPFEETQYKQFQALPMEKLAAQVNFSKLKGIHKWYKQFLAPLRRLTPEKKAALVRKLDERIAEAQRLLSEKAKAVGAAAAPKKKDAATLVYASLQENQAQTKESLSAETGLSRATVTRALQKLFAQGKIYRVGSNKTGWWEVV